MIDKLEQIIWMKQEENIAIEENKKIHQDILNYLGDTPKQTISHFTSHKSFWRAKTIEKLELFIDKEIYGNVMEIGAGTAWCSALLSKKEYVDKVYSVEFDLFAIENIIPKVLDAFNAKNEKITLVLGSYDDIKLEDNSLDFIFGMGAMHHSQNLYKTYSELFRVLKPGGTILISDPAYTNSLTLKDEYEWRENKKENGSKNKDNGDQKFRLCQWEAYAYQAGFNVNAFTFDRTGSLDESLLFGDEMIKNRFTYDRFDKIVLYPYFAQNPDKPEYDRLMLILEKPKNLSYKAMSENIYDKTN